MHINLITLWSEPGNLYQSSLWLRPMLKLVFLVNEIFELGLIGKSQCSWHITQPNDWKSWSNSYKKTSCKRHNSKNILALEWSEFSKRVDPRKSLNLDIWKNRQYVIFYRWDQSKENFAREMAWIHLINLKIHISLSLHFTNQYFTLRLWIIKRLRSKFI